MIEKRSGKYNAPTPMIGVPLPSLTTHAGWVSEKRRWRRTGEKEDVVKADAPLGSNNQLLLGRKTGSLLKGTMS